MQGKKRRNRRRSLAGKSEKGEGKDRIYRRGEEFLFFMTTMTVLRRRLLFLLRGYVRTMQKEGHSLHHHILSRKKKEKKKERKSLRGLFSENIFLRMWRFCSSLFWWSQEIFSVSVSKFVFLVSFIQYISGLSRKPRQNFS